MWLRLDLRRRWRSLVALGLLIALATGTVMTSVAGARRASTSVERLLSRTAPATVAVLPNDPTFDWSKVRALPQVESLSTIVIDYEIVVAGQQGDVLSFPPGDGEVMRSLEKPVMFKGRTFEDERPDEVVVSPRFVSDQHRDVGDTVVLHLPTPAELEEGSVGRTASSYHGPTVRARIVGVGKSPWYLDLPGKHGVVALSPGLAKAYPGSIIGKPENPVNFVNAIVRVKGGEAGIPAFQTAFEKLTGRSDVDFMDLAGQARDFRRHVAFEAQSLLAFAVAVFAAALFLVGQAIVRHPACP